MRRRDARKFAFRAHFVCGLSAISVAHFRPKSFAKSAKNMNGPRPKPSHHSHPPRGRTLHRSCAQIPTDRIFHFVGARLRAIRVRCALLARRPTPPTRRRSRRLRLDRAFFFASRASRPCRRVYVPIAPPIIGDASSSLPHPSTNLHSPTGHPRRHPYTRRAPPMPCSVPDMCTGDYGFNPPTNAEISREGFEGYEGTNVMRRPVTGTAAALGRILADR